MQYQGILKARPQGSKLRLSTPEKKLLVAFFFYVIFGVVVLLFYGVSTDNSYNLHQVIVAYFECEASGFVPGRCNKYYEDIQALNFSSIDGIILVLLGCVPCVNLIFVVNWKYLKEKLMEKYNEHIDIYRTVDSSGGDDTVLSHARVRYRAM